MVLTSGEDETTIDAGMYQPATISDRVWTDSNANGIQDSGELGLGGVTVNLYGAAGTLVATTTTDGNGSYRFQAPPGTYTVEFVPPAGYRVSPPGDGTNPAVDSNPDPTTHRTAAITVASGQVDDTIDAGLYQYATIGDRIWDDANANGIQDGGEGGLAGVTVNLYDGAGNLQDSMTTDGSGNYSFQVVPGTYYVAFLPPADRTFSPQYAGSDPALDSNADTTTGLTDPVTVTSGQNESTLDAGLYQPAILGDRVWEDTDKDGIQDAGEPGISGVTVNLYDTAGNLLQTTTTAANGAYSFTIPPGAYVVQVAPPGDYNITQQGAGGDPALDSDPDPTTGRTAPVTITQGATESTVDAGLTLKPGAIGNLVWEDLNGNGIQDAGEGRG